MIPQDAVHQAHREASPTIFHKRAFRLALRFTAVSVVMMLLMGMGAAFSCVNPPPPPRPTYSGSVALPSREEHPGQTDPRGLFGWRTQIGAGVCCQGNNNKTVTLYSYYTNTDDRPVKAYFPPGTSEDPAESYRYNHPSNAGDYTISTDGWGLVINAVRKNVGEHSHRYEFFHITIKTTDSWPESSWTLYFRFDWYS